MDDARHTLLTANNDSTHTHTPQSHTYFGYMYVCMYLHWTGAKNKIFRFKTIERVENLRRVKGTLKDFKQWLAPLNRSIHVDENFKKKSVDINRFVGGT